MRLFADFGVEYHLDQSGAVTKVNKYEISVVASAVDPTNEDDCFACVA